MSGGGGVVLRRLRPTVRVYRPQTVEVVVGQAVEVLTTIGAATYAATVASSEPPIEAPVVTTLIVSRVAVGSML